MLKCRFALLVLCPGLIESFLTRNDINGLLSIPYRATSAPPDADIRLFSTGASISPPTVHKNLLLTITNCAYAWSWLLHVPVFPVSLPYTGCLTMPISRHFRHFIRATHACSLHNLHMVLTEIPWKITDNSRCGNRTHDSCLMRAEPYHLANPQYCS